MPACDDVISVFNIWHLAASGGEMPAFGNVSVEDGLEAVQDGALEAPLLAARGGRCAQPRTVSGGDFR